MENETTKDNIWRFEKSWERREKSVSEGKEIESKWLKQSWNKWTPKKKQSLYSDLDFSFVYSLLLSNKTKFGMAMTLETFSFTDSRDKNPDKGLICLRHDETSQLWPVWQNHFQATRFLFIIGSLRVGSKKSSKNPSFAILLKTQRIREELEERVHLEKGHIETANTPADEIYTDKK